MTTMEEVSMFRPEIIGRWIERKQKQSSFIQKYAIEIACQVPMMFFIHLWLLLAPYSNGTWTDIPLFAVRIFVAFTLFGYCDLGKVNMISAYTALAVDMFVSWYTEKSLATATRITTNCTNIDCFKSADNGVTLMVITSAICIQIIYLTYNDYRYSLTNVYSELCILVFNFMCFILIVYFHLNTVVYFLYKLSFTFTLTWQFGYRIETDERLQLSASLQRVGLEGFMSERWIARDVAATFTIVYFMVCFLIDAETGGFPTFVGKWTTSLLVLLSIGSLLCVISNFGIVITQFIMTGTANVRQVFESNEGKFTFCWMLVISIQGGIISTQKIEHTQNVQFVLLLASFAVLFQIFWTIESNLVYIFGSPDGRNYFSYIRALVFTCAMVMAPTFYLYRLSLKINYSFWPFLNATGLFLMLCRMAVTFIECSFLVLSHHYDDAFHIYSDRVYYTRCFKSIVSVSCTILLSYHSFNSPFLAGSVIIKFIVALIACIGAIIIAIIVERNSYRERRKLVGRVEYLTDAIAGQIAKYNDDCAICYERLNKGTRLTCGHIFHKACLKKWFQVKTTCPLCNTVVETVDGYMAMV